MIRKSNRPLFYVLDPQGQPQPADLLTFAEWMETADRTVGFDVFDGASGPVFISTVFLGIDHQWRTGGPPVLWETLIEGGPEDGRMRRYTSQAAALAGHQDICREIAAALRARP